MTVSNKDIQQAATILESGGLVAFPTETVYGLGADAENPVALAGIYAAKGRPSNHPLIVHLAPEADVDYWSGPVPPEARKLIDAFWPGPLTLILPRALRIPDAVSGGQNTIALRCPSHPVAQALLAVFKRGRGGVAAPSANKFGHVSPTTAQHVRDEFSGDPDNPVQCILDGGQSQVGIESSILDLSRLATHGPILLRPGQIGVERIATILGVMPGMADTAAPRASGTLAAHYAPRTPLGLVEPDELSETLQRLLSVGRRIAVMYYAAPRRADEFNGAQLVLAATPDGYAHDLYAALRAMDAMAADIILVEAPPQGSEWQAVNDRLRRAAHDSFGVLARLVVPG
jgi:L-threonylcarbamoyladenylate synthase